MKPAHLAPALALAAMSGSRAVDVTATVCAQLQSMSMSMSPCIAACAEAAAGQSGCSEPTDVSCMCSSDGFRRSIRPCVRDNCSPVDQADAERLAEELCHGGDS